MTIDGEFVARYIKYFLQLKNQYVIYKLPVDRVSPKSMYLKHKDQCDSLANLANKYRFDVVKYISFFIIKQNKFENDIDELLVSIQMMNNYVQQLQIDLMHEKIYKNFLKTVDFIVKQCIELKYNSVIDYIRYLISEKKLAAYNVSGNISTYFLAAIPKFNKVIEKLDNISRDEFKQLYDRYEKYHYDINEAFLKMKNIKINPIKFTNDAILIAKNV